MRVLRSVRNDLRDGVDGILPVHAEVLAHRQGGEDVGGVVGAHELRADQLASHTKPQERHVRRRRKNLGALVGDAVAEDVAGLLRGHFPEVGVILIEEDDRTALSAQPFVQLALGGLDALEGAESQQVGASHVGDQAVVRPADLHQLGDVVGMAGAHLDHGDLRVRGDGQQRKGHADVVVEIALRGGHAVFLREHGRDEVLGGGLAVGPGQADDGQLAVAHVGAVPDGQVAQGRERILHADQPVILSLPKDLRIRIDHRPGGPGFQRLQRIIVPVEILSPQGEEDLSPADGPAVGRHAPAAGQVFFV